MLLHHIPEDVILQGGSRGRRTLSFSSIVSDWVIYENSGQVLSGG